VMKRNNRISSYLYKKIMKKTIEEINSGLSKLKINIEARNEAFFPIYAFLDTFEKTIKRSSEFSLKGSTLAEYTCHYEKFRIKINEEDLRSILINHSQYLSLEPKDIEIINEDKYTIYKLLAING